jgi:hypothetical protein
MSLYSELEETEECAITEKEYIPSQRIQDTIIVPRIREIIKGHGSWTVSRDRKLDEYVASAKKIIAILVRIGEDNADSIERAMAMDLQDKHLPLEKEKGKGKKRSMLKSRDLGDKFQFENWKEASLTFFAQEQYLVMAPVVQLDGVKVMDIRVEKGCGMEFESCESFGEPTMFSQIYKVVLRSEASTATHPVRTTRQRRNSQW